MALKIILCYLLFQLTNLPYLVLTQSVLSPDESLILSIKHQWSNQPSLISLWDSILRPCNWTGIACSRDQTVTSISLRDQGITGEIPPNLCHLNNLTYLDLGNNDFSGHLQMFLLNCVNLRYVDLSYNEFTGTLPNDIASLFPRLQHFDLSCNHLSGGIPESFGDISCLDYLDLSTNNLVGGVPSGLLLLNNLSHLSLRQNQLSGPLPRLIKATNLTVIDVSMNNLNGLIPPEIRNLHNLEILMMSSNKFSGLIPVELSTLSNLIHLDLSCNMLTGRIPSELGQLRFGTIDFSYNNLSGKVPNTIVKLGYRFNFGNNSYLCSDSPFEDFPRCSSLQNASLWGSRSSYLLVVSILSSAIVLILLAILYMILKKRNRESLQTLPSDWIMTAFHNVDFRESKILSGLREDSVIGSGGSGKIYLVAVNDSGDKVAVKRMWDNRKSSYVVEKQILAEADILGRIRHINILKLLCVISKEGMRLLVYEYMENHSLDKWLHRRPTSSVLDWPTRLRVAIGAAKGLCYMHNDCSPPIIHRDVKSSNILLDSEFNAKIADFGLAKMSAHRIGEPHTASVVAGTFGYIAPEYWRTRRVSEKIDIYSFGVVLLELATGKEPCKGNDHLNLAQRSWNNYIEGHPMEDELDSTIKEACYLQEMLNMFKVGLMCTSIVPSSRPSMKDVLKLLIACSYNETV